MARAAALNGEKIEAEKFIQLCKDGSFVDYDGFGEPWIAGVLRKSVWPGGELYIYPSHVVEQGLPEGTTHVQWYNR